MNILVRNIVFYFLFSGNRKYLVRTFIVAVHAIPTWIRYLIWKKKGKEMIRLLSVQTWIIINTMARCFNI